MFQHRSNIEKALLFLKMKSVNDALSLLAKCNHQPYRDVSTVVVVNKTRRMMRFGNTFSHKNHTSYTVTGQNVARIVCKE